MAEAVDLTVVTGPSHAEGIARWRARHARDPGTYVPVGEPAWTRWLPGGRGERVSWFVRYLAWLRTAARCGRDLHARRPFDVVWHVSYATYWLPSTAAAVGPPVVWGPVGGAVRTPPSLWPVLGFRGLLGEAADAAAVGAGALLPATRRTWRAADIAIVQNDETLAALPAELRARATVLNHAVFAERPGEAVTGRRAGAVLHLSPLERRKGPALVLRALATTPPDVTVAFVGDGPQRPALERLTERLGLSGRVRFLGRVPHSHVSGLLATAPAAIFTGLREEGGIALAEALGAGTPTVVLGHGGARTVAAGATDPERVVVVAPRSVTETARRVGAAMTRFTREPVTLDATLLDVDSARERLLQLLRATAERRVHSAEGPVPPGAGEAGAAGTPCR